MARYFALPGLALALLVTGCATPQAALQQARHGASLIGKLEQALAEFRRTEQVSEEARRDLVREQVEDKLFVDGISGRSARARRSAGDAQTDSIIERLRADSDAIASDEAAQQAASRANDDALAALLTPLPSMAQATAAAQQRMAEMGTELSPTQRLAQFRQLVQAVKDAVEANRDKLKAQTKAAAQAASAVNP